MESRSNKVDNLVTSSQLRCYGGHQTIPLFSHDLHPSYLRGFRTTGIYVKTIQAFISNSTTLLTCVNYFYTAPEMIRSPVTVDINSVLNKNGILAMVLCVVEL